MKKFLLILPFLLLAPQFASATTIYLTSGSSWTVPSDWNSANNTIEVIGGGGSGSGGDAAVGGGGAGGGAYSEISDLSLTPSASVQYSVGGVAGDTWFNGATFGASSVAAKGGANASASTGGAGGASASGIGTLKYSGGNGASAGPSPNALGGGGAGAAGLHGNGNNGSHSGVTVTGGSGDAGSGGAGGPNGTGIGGNGTEYDSTHGSGGGGGGGNAGSFTGGAAGSYGAGGGGGVKGGTTGGTGTQGLIVITYTPVPALLQCTGGTELYSTPGTYARTVPTFSSMSITVNGAGGGGGGGGALFGATGSPGSSGGDSNFNAVFGYGGGGGGGGYYHSGFGSTIVQQVVGGVPVPNASNGTSGSGLGGTTTTGGGAAGGSGGAGNNVTGTSGNGGSGGAGGSTTNTYTTSTLTPGSTATIVVGSGGAGGSPASGGSSGTSGGNGSVSIMCSAAAPSCSVSLSPNPTAYGSSSTLTYSSSNASTFYINNVGYVVSSGSASVPAVSTTDYTGQAGNGTATTTCAASLTVTPPATPTATIAASSTSIHVGGSTNITATFAAASNDTLTHDNIDQPEGVGQGATTNPDAGKSIHFTPSSAGTYTFFARAQTSYYGSWTSYASTTVTVLPSCTPSTVYSCTPASGYDGSGNSTVVQTVTDSSCNVTVTNAPSCHTPSYCAAPSSSCLYPPPSFTQSGSLTGHLQAVPSLVPQGLPTKLFWNISNVSSCGVTGTNGDHWTGTASPSGGDTSAPILQQTVFALSCAGLDGSSVSESQTVNVLPVFQER